VDIAGLSRALGLSAERGDETVLVEALRDDDGAARPGFPAARGLAQLREVPVPASTHAMYSGIWFALSLAGVGLTRARFRGGRRGRR
jgi:hypothetical protein